MIIIVGRTPEICQSRSQSDSGFQHALLPLSIVKASLGTNIQVTIFIRCLCAADCTALECPHTLRRVRCFCLPRSCRRDFLFPTTVFRVVSSILCRCRCLEAGIASTLTPSFHTARRQALCHLRQSRQGRSASTHARRCGPNTDDTDGAMA
jgi:hypothetical protein